MGLIGLIQRANLWARSYQQADRSVNAMATHAILVEHVADWS